MSKLLRILIVAALLPACAGDDPEPTGDDDDDTATDTDTDTPTGGTGSTSTGETGTTPSCYDDPAELFVGTGEAAFQPLTDGDPVELVFGTQGGYHMVASLRTCHMALSPPVTVHLTQTDELTGAEVLNVTLPTPLFDEGDCCGWRSMGALQLDNFAVPGAPPITGEFGDWMNGRIVVFTMEVSDSLGNQVSSSVRVTAAFEP